MYCEESKRMTVSLRAEEKANYNRCTHLPIFNLALMANPAEPSNLINALPFNLNN